LYLTAKKVIRYFLNIEPIENNRNKGKNTDITELVKCSVCGTYISKELTTKEYKNNEIHYICSKECLAKFNKK
jgi:hypothetical protein